MQEKRGKVEKNKMSLLTRDEITHALENDDALTHTSLDCFSREQRELVQRRVYIYTHSLLRSLGMSHQRRNSANAFGRIKFVGRTACSRANSCGERSRSLALTNGREPFDKLECERSDESGRAVAFCDATPRRHTNLPVNR